MINALTIDISNPELSLMMTENNFQSLTKVQVYELASELGLGIIKFINTQWYDKTNIKLSLGFSAKNELNAYAETRPSIDNPSEHKVTLTYRLVDLLYTISKHFSKFAINRNGIDILPNSDLQLIPLRFDEEIAAKLMFEHILAFVIFHEIGHINQSHGEIRQKYTKDVGNSNIITEFLSDKDSDLTGIQACIFHATEFAADMEALDWVFGNIMLQFNEIEILDHAYLQCGIISYFMLTFCRENPCNLNHTPLGTHPSPRLRMDMFVRAFAERLYVLLMPKGVTITHQQIFKKLSDSSFWASILWLEINKLHDNNEYDTITTPITSHYNFKPYMKKIVDVWSENYEFARDSRRYEPPFSVMYFSDDFRSEIGAENNKESLKSHIEKSKSIVLQNIPKK